MGAGGSVDAAGARRLSPPGLGSPAAAISTPRLGDRLGDFDSTAGRQLQFEVKKLTADARLGVILASDAKEFPVVVEVEPDELFAKAGIQNGDRIVAIWTTRSIWNAAGATWTSTVLREAPAGEAITIHIERDAHHAQDLHSRRRVPKGKMEEAKHDIPIHITKSTQDACVGVTFSSQDGLTHISSLANSGLLVFAGALVGDELRSVDGTTPKGAIHAAQLLKQASGASAIRLVLRRHGNCDAYLGRHSPTEVIDGLSEVTVRL